MALAVALVLMAAIVALTIPSGDPTSRIAGIQQSPAGATVVISIKIDAVNAAGTFTARIQVVPGHSGVFPVDGAVVYTDIGGLPPIKVYSDVLPATYSVVIDATAGEVSSYPFDRYATTVGFQVAAGTERTLKEAFVQPTLPFAVIGESSASGFDVEGTTAASAVGTGEVTFDARRSASTKSWAIAMMVINWLVALASVGVASPWCWANGCGRPDTWRGWAL